MKAASLAQIDKFMRAHRRILTALTEERASLLVEDGSAKPPPGPWPERLAAILAHQEGAWLKTAAIGRLLELPTTPKALAKDLRAVAGPCWRLPSGDLATLSGRIRHQQWEWRVAVLDAPTDALILSISGPPGSGKTTLLDAIAAMVEPTHHVERQAPRPHELILRRRGHAASA